MNDVIIFGFITFTQLKNDYYFHTLYTCGGICYDMSIKVLYAYVYVLYVKMQVCTYNTYGNAHTEQLQFPNHKLFR